MTRKDMFGLMPLDIFDLIAKKLSQEDLLKLAETSRYLRQLTPKHIYHALQCPRTEKSRSLANRLWNNIEEEPALESWVREFDVPEPVPVRGKDVGKPSDPVELLKSLPNVRKYM
ncbi:hypothetical protein MMC30_006596 [Trapelia coarctata]|nr:hypothetical protein [Trapelia coarctata]